MAKSYFLTTTRIRESPTYLETSKTAFSSTSSAWSGGPQKGSRQLPFILQSFTFTEDFFFWTSIYSVLIQGANAIKGLTAKVRLVHISLFVCSAHNHNLAFTTNHNHNLAFTDGQQ